MKPETRGGTREGAGRKHKIDTEVVSCYLAVNNRLAQLESNRNVLDEIFYLTEKTLMTNLSQLLLHEINIELRKYQKGVLHDD